MSEIGLDENEMEKKKRLEKGIFGLKKGKWESIEVRKCSERHLSTKVVMTGEELQGSGEGEHAGIHSFRGGHVRKDWPCSELYLELSSLTIALL
jgi:hypothetical protein